jgi:SAM-dependent methyltransferase
MTSRSANFDRIARLYCWMEYLTFAHALERCRFHFLPQLTECRTALVLGDGDGRFLARLLAINPRIKADAIDSSAAMLHLLTLRCSQSHPTAAARLQTHHINALSFEASHDYDLIATHFFLDCLTQDELETLALRLAAYSQPGTLWLVSDFRVPSGPMHWPARVLVRTLYLAFRVLTNLRVDHLPDHATALRAVGFSLKACHESLAGLLTSQLWEYTPTMLPPQKLQPAHPPDAIPNPEPPSPSLPEPDPAVFHPDSPKPHPEPPAS